MTVHPRCSVKFTLRYSTMSCVHMRAALMACFMPGYTISSQASGAPCSSRNSRKSAFVHMLSSGSELDRGPFTFCPWIALFDKCIALKWKISKAEVSISALSQRKGLVLPPTNTWSRPGPPFLSGWDPPPGRTPLGWVLWANPPPHGCPPQRQRPHGHESIRPSQLTAAALGLKIASLFPPRTKTFCVFHEKYHKIWQVDDTQITLDHLHRVTKWCNISCKQTEKTDFEAAASIAFQARKSLTRRSRAGCIAASRTWDNTTCRNRWSEDSSQWRETTDGCRILCCGWEEAVLENKSTGSETPWIKYNNSCTIESLGKTFDDLTDRLLLNRTQLDAGGREIG